jgi:hypothetical protein
MCDCFVQSVYSEERKMVSRIFILLCVTAFILPVVNLSVLDASESEKFVQWPTTMNGSELIKLPLSEKEQRFNSGFPGDIARFTDGQREYVVRWISAASRKVHPAADCFRGIGYTLTPQPLVKDKQGHDWGSFIATNITTRQHSVLKIQERIYDEAGNNWTDISGWYWAAMFGKTQGPWWAITVAERI